MSKDIWSDDEFTEFSYRTNERQYTGVYLSREYLDRMSIAVPQNIPERIEETINENTGAVHTFGQINQLRQNSATTSRPLINTDGLNGTPISLNVECGEPVIKSYYGNNTEHTPLDMNNVVNIPNIRIEGPSNCGNQNRYYNEPYFLTSFHRLMSVEQRESGQLSPYRIANTSPSIFSEFSSPDRCQDSLNNDDVICIQEYDRYSGRSSSSSSYRCESVIKYGQITENKWETFNKSKLDPRLINRDRNTYRLDNFEGLKPLSYTNTETDEDLRIVDKKLKNTNSSNKFGVINDLRNADNFNKNNIISYSESDPRIKKIQIDRESKISIDCNEPLNIFNAKGCNNLNVEKKMDLIDLSDGDDGDVDLVNDTETTKASNIFEEYLKKKNEIRKFREEEQKKLTETVDNIIVNLNEDMSDLRCVTRKCSMKNDEMIKTHDINDQTKYNIKETNENILTVENSNVDNNTHQNVDNLVGLIGTHQNHKRLSGQTIELIDLTNEDTADSTADQIVDIEMFISKMKDEMSTTNEDKSEKINKASENSEELPINKNETNAENILNENHSVVDQRKTSEKKSSKCKSQKRNKSKDNYKHSETYKDRNSNKTDSSVMQIDSAFENNNSELEINSCQISDEQTNNAEMWTKPFKQQKKTDKNELINEPDGVVQHGNETSTNSNKKKCMKNACEIIENIKNKKHSLVDSISSGIYVGVQLNPNTSTKSATSLMDVDEKIHYNHDQLSIRVQDPNKTTWFNFPNKNHKSSIDFEKRVPDTDGILKQTTNEDSLKSNTVQALSNPEQDESDNDVEERLIEFRSEYISNRISTINYASINLNCKSNEEPFKRESFENFDDEKCMSYYTEYQNSDTNETDIYESPEDASQLQRVDSMFGNSPYIDRECNSKLDVGKEVPPYIKLSEHIFNENSKSCDANDFNYNLRLIKLEHSKVSNYEQFLTHDMQDTDINETEFRAGQFEDFAQSPIYSSIAEGKPDVVYKASKNEPLDSFLKNILKRNSETRDSNESNKGRNLKRNVPSVEDEDIEINKGVLCPNESPADEQSADVQLVGEHFEMDYFYNIIKINPSLFRVNLHTEDDIFNFIQLYSQRTQTSWRVLKSFKSQKYDICKVFGCLHNGLFKLLKKPDKKVKPNKCECQSEIVIKIKCSTVKGKNKDPYLKNGLPAIVRFKNDHNHLVTELPLLKSITDNNMEITFDNGLEPAKIREACNIGISPNSSPLVIDITNLSDDDAGTTGTMSDQITENNLFSKWEDVRIERNIVKTDDNGGLQPGLLVINNDELASENATSHQLVDTSYNKDYCRKLTDMMSENVKAKWLSDKMTTEADQVSLYKCSGKKCNAVFKRRRTFVSHLNEHCRNSKSQKKTLQFMICMYCFKSFDKTNIDALADHISDNYSSCKYFCQYCLYRANTASHVLVHEYKTHREQKPSILQLEDRAVYGNSKDVLKVVDFNKFVPRYVCNLGDCSFYSYMDSDFLYHLSHDHVDCDQFYCDICDQSNDDGFVALNPISFVKHFSSHNMNTYQCIFCLFGTETTNLMIIHLAMEHFEYEPLCLERLPINIFCDDKNIENLTILNIRKSIPAGIIKTVNGKSLKNLNKKKCQPNPSDTICTNAKLVNIGNTTRVSRSSIKEVVRPSKNTIKPTIDNKNNTVISEEAKSNVSRKSQRILNVAASIVNEKKKPSQMSIYEVMNNSELKKKFGKPFKEKGLKIPSSDEMIVESKKYINKILDNTCENIGIRQTRSGNRYISTKTVEIEKTTQLSKRTSKKSVHPPKNTKEPEIDNKNIKIISEEVKKNVPRDEAERIAKSVTSIENDKNKSSQLTIHDISKNSTKKTEIDNKNNTVVSDEVNRNVQSDNAKRIQKSVTSIENDKNKSSQLIFHDIRKYSTKKPEIDTKNNTVVSEEVNRNVQSDNAKRIQKSVTSIENDKNKSSQLIFHDIRKYSTKKPEIDTKNNTVVSEEVNRNVQRDNAKRIPKSVKTIEDDKNKSSQLTIHDIRKNSTKKPEIDNKNNTAVTNEVNSNVQSDSAKRIPKSVTSIENDKNKSSQLTIHDIRKNRTKKPEIDNKNNTAVTDEVNSNVQSDNAKRIRKSVTSIENDKNKPSQLIFHDIRKYSTKKPEIDNKNNNVVSDEVNRNVQSNNAKRIRKSVTSIENDKNKSSQLTIHDIRKNSTKKTEIDNKNNTVVSDEVNRNVQKDNAKRIPKSVASVENDKNKSSQLSVHDIVKNIKSKKAIEKPVKEKSLESSSSDEPIDQGKFISNIRSEKVIPAGISYQDHLNKCPAESPMKCTFCLAQSESTFDVIKMPRLLVPNRFTCTFCNLELPSSDTIKSHLKEVHNVSNAEFVPVNINMTDIEKDRFLVCEDKSLKRQKRANDSSFYTENCKNMTVANNKRSKVVSKHDDFQLTSIENTTNTSKQQVNPDDSQHQHKTMKRKYSNDSTNNVADIDYKKTPSWKRLYDTIPGVKISMYFSPHNINNIPPTQYFSKPVGCLLCHYHTKVRSNLVSHLKVSHRVESVSNKHTSPSVPYKLKPAVTATKPVNNSPCSSFEPKHKKKAKRVVQNTATIDTIKNPSFKMGNYIPEYVPITIRFRCAVPTCYHLCEDLVHLEHHITKYHSKFEYLVCPHCRPLIVTFNNFRELECHFNFHGNNLYICQYCDYIHYNHLKIESHQTRKHPLKMDGENNLNVVTIRESNVPDIQTSKWQCNICIPGIKYTLTQITAHLSIVHKITEIFRCYICHFVSNDHQMSEQHFMSNHPDLEMKYESVHFKEISPDVDLEPTGKQTEVGIRGRTKESHLLNVQEAFDGVAEPMTALPSPQETSIKSTPAFKTPAESLDVSKNQRETLDNITNALEIDSNFLMCPMAKYECPICIVFEVEEIECFRRHLLNEIDCTLWKCLECFSFRKSEVKIKIHLLKHDRSKRQFKEIDISQKNMLVDGIIEYQNMIIEHKVLKKKDQLTNCIDQKGTKHGNVQQK